ENEFYRATSIYEQTKKKWELQPIVQEILRQFEQSYEQYITKGFSNIKTTWENYGFRMNEKLTYTAGNKQYTALFIGISEDGALLVQHDNGQVEKVYSAEIAWF